MARLGDINPQATRFTSTTCPGTDVYMPPEAVQDKSVYTEKIDCFSFGVIIVQTLTRQFPKPGDRLERVELNHPGLRKKSVLVEVSEIDRRQNHISQVDLNHSLLPIALDCLKDEGSERPSAHQLCERVADLKGKSDYRDSAIAIQDKDEVIRQQRQQIREKGQANKQLEEGERLLNQRLRQLQLENDQNAQLKEEKERQLGRVNQQLEASEQVVAQFERRIAELEEQLCQREQQKTKASIKGKELTSFKLRWREGKRAPCETYRNCDSVVDGSNTVYVTTKRSKNIYSYHVINDSWSQLPDCVHEYSSLTVINGWLTTVGGTFIRTFFSEAKLLATMGLSTFSDPRYSNNLLSLTGEGSGRRWTKIFPPMPTKRKRTTSLCTGITLIVAGGEGEGGRGLSTVEVMNTETCQWSTAADLPRPMYYASATVCGDQLYMLGGVMDNHVIKSAYTCSVSALLQSCVPNSLEVKFQRTSLEDKARVWRQVADLPVTLSTCESFHGRLLAVGGWMESDKVATAVYMYNSTTNSWEIISHMTTGRRLCFTAVLPDNRLMVVGGNNKEGLSYVSTDSVELATVCDN
jgi:serine/threonine protein kinase